MRQSRRSLLLLNPPTQFHVAAAFPSAPLVPEPPGSSGHDCESGDKRPHNRAPQGSSTDLGREAQGRLNTSAVTAWALRPPAKVAVSWLGKDCISPHQMVFFLKKENEKRSVLSVLWFPGMHPQPECIGLGHSAL